MFSQAGGVQPGPSATVAPLGAEHVRLFYHYLDLGDTEGLVSLLDPDTRFRYPGRPTARGPSQVVSLLDRPLTTHTRHSLFKTVAEGDTVVAIGRFTRERESEGNRNETEFVDVFTLSEHGLLLACRRYRWVN
ncbi:nuclear transport factor 2 family protein [Nocardiopsis sp. CNT312]|uniref:nuclear transport factor 2 family protein n=1 Tax=Nocardiopsis sp. CNT312 TaxID=1137268 RepID=UPI000687AB96|nr:nuclear transport factor 2 family protein [Nocardiopsis sp. CNT312]